MSRTSDLLVYESKLLFLLLYILISLVYDETLKIEDNPMVFLVFALLLCHDSIVDNSVDMLMCKSQIVVPNFEDLIS